MSEPLIVLDPGHGEFGNPYPYKEGCYEGTQNFKLALLLKEELVNRGFRVLLTRNAVTDDPDLKERGELAGNNGAVMFLSLHSNAPSHTVPEDVYRTIRGAETYYSLTDEERNRPIADALNDAVCRIMDTPSRGTMIKRYPGVPEDDYYGVIRASAKSGCKQAFLIEHGFHTNDIDAGRLTDDSVLAEIAKAEAEIIAANFLK